ncbi:response regulator [Paenibacillus sp. JNUCC31]|uniref:response regulator transcription factor n=1 Tax=Paenibacillus sp. JNUCC-31 TaxID=2777983 RepID=UPI00177FA382|nr:response regulator [Paenibacillus sp. JNUCC-31]QOS79410.1 response regulator [Paenibacillus sp. JNUCC-31]
MYQLLIVDDESSVVESLTLTIPWEKYGIENIYSACSAQEALQIASKHSIDIMITDIRMPEIDGLELIERIQHFSRKIRIIILSGHDEFDYAKKAMKLQVLDYLLKPINFDELIHSVRKAIQDIENEWKEISSLNRIQQTLHANLPLLRSQLLNDLLNNKSIPKNILEERLNTVGVSFRLDDSYLMMVLRMEEDFSGYELQSLSLLEYAITNIAEEVFIELFELWHCITEKGYLVFLVKSSDQQALKMVDSFAVKLQNHVQKYLKGSLSICLSKLGRFPDGLPALYLSSVNAINRNIGHNKSFFLTLDPINQEPPQERIHSEMQAPPLLPFLLDSGDWDEVLSKIDRILSIKGSSIEYTQDQLFSILLYLSSSFSLVFITENNELNEELNEELNLLLQKKGHLSKQRIYDWAKKNIECLKLRALDNIKDSHNHIVARIRTFIQKKLSTGISIQDAANHVGMHPVYLSKVYKTVTDETIGDYIYRIRMERAVQLLKNTDMKVSEISGQLGYLAVPHFIKIFKKEFGTTPQDFRNH